MKNLVSIFAGHDASVSFWNAETDKYYTIEIERLVKKRYFRLHEDNSPEEQKNILEQCRDIAEKEWGIKNDYEAVLICSDGYVQTDPREIFNTEKVTTVARHHQTHAAAAFYQSPFCEGDSANHEYWVGPGRLDFKTDNDTIIFSFDGGGDDGHMNIYNATSDGEIKLLDTIKSDFGGGYLLCASMIREVAESSRHQLALSGKMMGLVAYGSVIEHHTKAFTDFFFDRDYRKLAERTKLPLKNLDMLKFKISSYIENLIFTKIFYCLDIF